MPLRHRIALTFLLLLAAVLAAILCAVFFATRATADMAVRQQLQNNRRLLTLSAQAIAHDYGFHEALALRDGDTLISALENGGDRIGAQMVVLTSLTGQVMAASGVRMAAGDAFPAGTLRSPDPSADCAADVLVDAGKLYQVVGVAVNSPLPVALIVAGYELDENAAQGLAKLQGLKVRLFTRTGNLWTGWVTTHPAGVYAAAGGAPPMPPARPALGSPQAHEDILSRSLKDATAPFRTLNAAMLLIAAASLAGFAGAAFWIARNITRPLRELTESVDHIRAGTYDVTLDLHRGDEIGVLAEGLQLMQTAVMTRDQSIRRLAFEDALTGLMNRTAFNDRLSAALTAGTPVPIAVAVIDLNRFRRINEHLGLSVGDAVLIEMAARLTAVPGIESAVARLAADQFAAFTPLPDPSALQAWGSSLLAALAAPIVVESQPIDTSATIGLALAIPGTPLGHDLLSCADLALERARRDKRPLAVYEEGFTPPARDQLSLLGELQHAVDHDELRLVFQPKIELATNRVAGAEVLIRWQHPTRGLLSPAAFVPFAEQTGFIRRMTRWTLEHAVAQGARWLRDGNPLPLAVNISADDLGDLRLDNRVAALLTRYQLPPSLLTLELTESGFIEDPNQALRMLDALATLGVTLSIDDFGTGYSSLSHLARMPVHEVKIDRSFVQGLETDPEFAAVVRSAIDMGHSLGLKVVAEGIETEVAAQRLKAFGCDIVQGYFYAKPMPGEVLQAWMAGRTRVPVIATPVDFNVDDVTDTASLATY